MVFYIHKQKGVASPKVINFKDDDDKMVQLTVAGIVAKQMGAEGIMLILDCKSSKVDLKEKDATPLHQQGVLAIRYGFIDKKTSIQFHVYKQEDGKLIFNEPIDSDDETEISAGILKPVIAGYYGKQTLDNIQSGSIVPDDAE